MSYKNIYVHIKLVFILNYKNFEKLKKYLSIDGEIVLCIKVFMYKLEIKSESIISVILSVFISNLSNTNKIKS